LFLSESIVTEVSISKDIATVLTGGYRFWLRAL